ncbi:MAG: DUF6752 domain-containing protein [Nocardioidaceae bacterium]
MTQDNTSPARGAVRPPLTRRVGTKALHTRDALRDRARVVKRLRARTKRHEQRLNALEQALQEQRALSMRVAQLTDIVQELLIPVADRDEAKLHRLLEEYSETF